MSSSKIKHQVHIYSPDDLFVLSDHTNTQSVEATEDAPDTSNDQVSDSDENYGARSSNRRRKLELVEDEDQGKIRTRERKNKKIKAKNSSKNKKEEEKGTYPVT